MVRFTIRDVLWLTAAVVVGATVLALRSRSENDSRSITRRASDEELKAINVRYEAAKGEFDYHVSRNRGSGIWPSADEYCASIERFAEAAEARDDLEARVKDLAAALEFAQQKASASLDQYESGVDPANEVYRFQYTRADMEARLWRAEQELVAAQETR